MFVFGIWFSVARSSGRGTGRGGLGVSLEFRTVLKGFWAALMKRGGKINKSGCTRQIIIIITALKGGADWLRPIATTKEVVPGYHLSITNTASQVFYPEWNPSVYERMKSGFRAVPLCLYFDTWRPSALSKQSVGGPGQVVVGMRMDLAARCPTTLQRCLRVPPLFLTQVTHGRTRLPNWTFKQPAGEDETRLRAAGVTSPTGPQARLGSRISVWLWG